MLEHFNKNENKKKVKQWSVSKKKEEKKEKWFVSKKKDSLVSVPLSQTSIMEKKFLEKNVDLWVKILVENKRYI